MKYKPAENRMTLDSHDLTLYENLNNLYGLEVYQRGTGWLKDPAIKALIDAHPTLFVLIPEYPIKTPVNVENIPTGIKVETVTWYTVGDKSFRTIDEAQKQLERNKLDNRKRQIITFLNNESCSNTDRITKNYQELLQILLQWEKEGK